MNETINIKTRKGAKLQLNGNRMSGDTYAAKGYIKAYMDGKWDGTTKTWIVNREKTIKLLETQGTDISYDGEAKVELNSKSHNGICPKCGGYCYGDCSAN